MYEETHFKQLLVDFKDVPMNALFINLKKENLPSINQSGESKDGNQSGEYYDGMHLLYKLKKKEKK